HHDVIRPRVALHPADELGAEVEIPEPGIPDPRHEHPDRAHAFSLPDLRGVGWQDARNEAGRPRLVLKPVTVQCATQNYSSVQAQELTSRTIVPRPVSMWVVHGMQGSN